MKAKPLDLFAATLTGALCVVWGFNQVVAKLALPDVGPIMQTGVRSAIGAICVVGFALATNRRLFDLDGTEAAGALAGVLFTGEFIALYESLRFTTAARATVFVYAAPFFVAFGAAFLLKDERLRPIQWAGLGLAFLGVACGMAGRTPGGALAGDALALLAAALWGATTLVIKATPLKRADPLKVLLYQIGAAALIAPAAAYAFGEPAPVHLSGVATRIARLAGRRRGGRKLRALVLGADALRRRAALRLHLHLPARWRVCRLARIRRDDHRRLRPGDRPGARRACARQLAAPARKRILKGYLPTSVASNNASASSIAALCVAARGTAVGQTGTAASPAGVHSARKS